MLFALFQIGIGRSRRSRLARALPCVAFADLRAARLRDRPLDLEAPHAQGGPRAAATPSGAELMDVRTLHRRAGRRELPHRAPRRRARGGDDRPRRRGRAPARGRRRARPRRSRRSSSPTRTSTTSARSRRVARATGRPCGARSSRCPVLADIMRYVPWPGFGPYESYDADHTVAGGETLQLAGLDIEVLFTPGHSPGHVTYRVADEQAIFSGDVLFAGLDRAHGPAGRRHGDADADARRAARPAARRDRRVPRATWADTTHRPRARDQPVPRPARA